MKILILNDYAYIEGGAGKIAIESAFALLKAGHEVTFFSAVGPVSEIFENAKSIKVICLNQPDILSNPSKFDAIIKGIVNRKACSELENLVDKWKPDIAHLHGVSKALSWAAADVLYKKKIPAVATLHDFGLLCPNMGIYDFRKNSQCELYKPYKAVNCLFTNCDKRSYFQKLWRWYRFRYTRDVIRILRKLSALIFVSDFSAGIFLDFIPEDLKYRIINNPFFEASTSISAMLDRRGQEELVQARKKAMKFIYVGRLSAEKGIDVMLEAFKEIDANLDIIGDGELIKDCEKAAEISGGRIKVLGYKSQEYFSETMIDCLALILPSRVAETSGLVVMTAASHMLPSIVPDAGAPADFVADGENGLQFKSGDSDSLRQSIYKFLKNPRLSVEMGMKSRQKIKSMDGSMDNYIKNLENFYNEIITGCR